MSRIVPPDGQLFPLPDLSQWALHDPSGIILDLVQSGKDVTIQTAAIAGIAVYSKPIAFDAGPAELVYTRTNQTQRPVVDTIYTEYGLGLPDGSVVQSVGQSLAPSDQRGQMRRNLTQTGGNNVIASTGDGIISTMVISEVEPGSHSRNITQNTSQSRNNSYALGTGTVTIVTEVAATHEVFLVQTTGGAVETVTVPFEYRRISVAYR